MRRKYILEGKFLGIIVPVGIFMEKSVKSKNLQLDLLKTVYCKLKLRLEAHNCICHIDAMRKSIVKL